MFRKAPDFEAFECVMVEAHQRQPIRILSYCVLSNHWRFVEWPEEDGQLCGMPCVPRSTVTSTTHGQNRVRKADTSLQEPVQV